MNLETRYDRYYLTYSGASLPLKMLSALSEDSIENRNTYFGVNLDALGRIITVHKLVYGSIELSHHYEYDEQGYLAFAQINNTDGEANKLWFDDGGNLVRREEECQ